MDRLLTDEEVKSAVYDKPEQGAARWTKTVIPRDNKVAKAQDAKTAHLVAKSPFKAEPVKWAGDNPVIKNKEPKFETKISKSVKRMMGMGGF